MAQTLSDCDKSAEWKRYRAYITRRSKWEAIRTCLRHDQVSAQVLRSKMIRAGDRKEDLDDAWEKKILGNTNIFKPVGDGFFELECDDSDPGKRPLWDGQRPWQDFVRDAYVWIVANVPRVDMSTESIGLMSPQWRPVSEVIVRAMRGLKAKGVKRPMVPLNKMAMEAIVSVDASTHGAEHAVSLWLTIASGDVDAYGRLKRYIDGHGERPGDILLDDGSGSPMYSPVSLKCGDEPHATDANAVLMWIRDRLVIRGILRSRA